MDPYKIVSYFRFLEKKISFSLMDTAESCIKRHSFNISSDKTIKNNFEHFSELIKRANIITFDNQCKNTIDFFKSIENKSEQLNLNSKYFYPLNLLKAKAMKPIYSLKKSNEAYVCLVLDYDKAEIIVKNPGENFKIMSMSIDLGFGEAIMKFVNYLSLYEDKKDEFILEELKRTSRPKTNINLAIIEFYANKYMCQNKNVPIFNEKYCFSNDFSFEPWLKELNEQLFQKDVIKLKRYERKIMISEEIKQKFCFEFHFFLSKMIMHNLSYALQNLYLKSISPSFLFLIGKKYVSQNILRDINQILDGKKEKIGIIEESFKEEDALKFFEYQKNLLQNGLLNWNEFTNFSPKKTNIISYEYFEN